VFELAEVLADVFRPGSQREQPQGAEAWAASLSQRIVAAGDSSVSQQHPVIGNTITDQTSLPTDPTKVYSAYGFL
jgi:hypothetical protein